VVDFFIIMIQTILLTALSAQLTYIKPALSPKPPTPQVVFTRVLPEENYGSFNMVKNEIEPTSAVISTAPSQAVSPTVAITTAPTTAPTIQQPTATSVPTVAVSNAASPISDAAITYLGNCEAGMNPARNSGNGYYGAFQFSYGTWKSLNTGYERADLAPIEVQEAAVKQLLGRSSIYNQFPGCARKMHDAGLI